MRSVRKEEAIRMQRIKALFAPRDMTQGAPWKSILMFAVPMLIGNFAQQLYNTVDSAVVGRYVGDNALAAVSSTMPILNLLLALFVGIATGAGIRVSQYFGAKDRENLSKVIGNCLTLTIITSFIIMAIGIPLADPLLRLLGTPPEIFGWTGDYLRIFFWGISGFLFYNVLSGILRGLGDSFSALLFLLFSAALNVVLDLWFVISFGMGVAGVALATIIAQSVSAVLCFLKLRAMKDVFDISPATMKLDKETAMDIIKLGLPSGLTQASFSTAMLLVLRLEFGFGAMFVATTGIVKRVDGFAMLPNFSFGQAMTTFIGQNVGARRYDRLKQGAKEGTALALATVILLTGAILLFGRGIMHIFTDTQEVVDLGMRIMKILALGYIAMAVTQTMSGVMRGAGDTVTPMAISMFVSVFIRVALTYALVELSKTPEKPMGEPIMVYISLLATWVVGALINTYYYRRGNWRSKLPPRDKGSE